MRFIFLVLFLFQFLQMTQASVFSEHPGLDKYFKVSQEQTFDKKCAYSTNLNCSVFIKNPKNSSGQFSDHIIVGVFVENPAQQNSKLFYECQFNHEPKSISSDKKKTKSETFSLSFCYLYSDQCSDSSENISAENKSFILAELKSLQKMALERHVLNLDSGSAFNVKNYDAGKCERLQSLYFSKAFVDKKNTTAKPRIKTGSRF